LEALSVRRWHYLPLTEGEDAEDNDGSDAGKKCDERKGSRHAGLGEDAPKKKDEEGGDDKADDEEHAHETGHHACELLLLLRIHSCLREMETNVIEIVPKSKSKSEVSGERAESMGGVCGFGVLRLRDSRGRELLRSG